MNSICYYYYKNYLGGDNIIFQLKWSEFNLGFNLSIIKKSEIANKSHINEDPIIFEVLNYIFM